jgi:hypothetical protein
LAPCQLVTFGSHFFLGTFKKLLQNQELSIKKPFGMYPAVTIHMHASTDQSLCQCSHLKKIHVLTVCSSAIQRRREAEHAEVEASLRSLRRRMLRKLAVSSLEANDDRG